MGQACSSDVGLRPHTGLAWEVLMGKQVPSESPMWQ